VPESKKKQKVTKSHHSNAVGTLLVEMEKDRAPAINHYQAAASKTGSLPERNHLLAQAARLFSEQESDGYPYGRDSAVRQPSPLILTSFSCLSPSLFFFPGTL
jgi:hypothetical protein